MFFCLLNQSQPQTFPFAWNVLLFALSPLVTTQFFFYLLLYTTQQFAQISLFLNRKMSKSLFKNLNLRPETLKLLEKKIKDFFLI